MTTPARRAHDTPENAVLVFALDAIRLVGGQGGWARSSSGDHVETARERVAEAERWLQARELAELRRAQPSQQTLARVRSGRAAARYQPALDVVDLHATYVRRLDRDALREAVQQHALVTSDNSVLLELLCAFRVQRALERLGWERLGRPGLVAHGPFLSAERGDSLIELHYQRAPDALVAEGSTRRSCAVTRFPT